jgi:hypothetical protein
VAAWVVVFAALLALTPRFVAAAEPPARPGRFKIGPLYLTPRIELKNAGVDTNVLLSRSNEVPDTSVVVSPSLEAVLPVGQRLRLSGRGALDVNYYRRRESERSNDPSGDGQIELTLGRWVLHGGGGAARSRQLFSIEFDERLERREKWGEAGLRMRLGSKVSLGASGRSHVFRYESFDLGGGQDVRELLDRNSLTGSVEARYALTRKTSAVLSADLIEDRFLRPSSFTSATARSYRYLGGLELGERAAVRGKLMAGYREFPQTAGAGVQPYRGPVLAVNAELPLRLLALLATAERDVAYSPSAAVGRDERLRGTSIYSRYRGELRAEVPFDLVASAGLEHARARSVVPVQRRGLTLRNVDRVWTVSGSLLRRFGDGVFIGGTVSWSRRLGSLPEDAYDRLVYGLQAQVTP